MCLAVPGEIVAIDQSDPLHPMGRIDFGGVIRGVSLAYLPEAVVGDWVVVHAGFAISLLDRDEAQASLAAFKALDATE
ncbi:HypC/HybG/HupF family hydrogenase formation chaperone [Niveibacterium sp. 24ML]|uniref:HypC/HybG/HupF family hydrogenase formation chaperone n=1 Tax=Niveibacterium sp. 24ML TaxID=2985512 RepID=UPI00226FA659|nr:HypC/HybG/HupF family hydrogenase formation chaperone [Niveibacterium sp. 24ML]MCX9156631.1 HypC/HybG/HupF family hydrogenase formation chaperone [Niveibacterium sp. 24ML]